MREGLALGSVCYSYNDVACRARYCGRQYIRRLWEECVVVIDDPARGSVAPVGESKERKIADSHRPAGVGAGKT